MVITLTGIIVVLIGVIFFQYSSRRTRNNDLTYIHQQLNRIITHDTGEKLLLFTGDKQIIALLVEINHLLENNQYKSANYTRTELSMKKMISNISHDLKTPLTVVLGYLETLNRDSEISSEERQLLLTKVHHKAVEVLGLIHKFFDLARIEAGDKDIPLARVNLNEICERNMLQFYDILTSKGYEVHIDTPEKPVYVMGNEEALDRILNNLISNAIHHGGDGHVVGLIVDEDQEFSYIHIWDKGKGINAQHQDRVFERMFTLEDSRNQSNPGSGLGLTITKRLVQNLGGTIKLASNPYDRTMLTVQLPKLRY